MAGLHSDSHQAQIGKLAFKIWGLKGDGGLRRDDFGVLKPGLRDGTAKLPADRHHSVTIAKKTIGTESSRKKQDGRGHAWMHLPPHKALPD